MGAICGVTLHVNEIAKFRDGYSLISGMIAFASAFVKKKGKIKK